MSVFKCLRQHRPEGLSSATWFTQSSSPGACALMHSSASRCPGSEKVQCEKSKIAFSPVRWGAGSTAAASFQPSRRRLPPCHLESTASKEAKELASSPGSAGQDLSTHLEVTACCLLSSPAQLPTGSCFSPALSQRGFIILVSVTLPGKVFFLSNH